MNTLFVSALPFKCTEEDIRKIFEPYGEIRSIRLFADWQEPTFEPYAHVEMANADQAVLALDGKQIGLTLLRVNPLVILSPDSHV